MDSLRGKLLIAMPGLSDFFRRGVVLIIDHSEEGAFGLMLNRPSPVSVAEAAPPLTDLVPGDDLIRIGGPVGVDSLIMLGQFERPELSPWLVAGDVGLVDPALGGEHLGQARIYAGHSGWSAGQLEEELESESWLVEPARPEDVLADDQLWADALKRHGGDWALLATMPEDPSLN